MATALSDVFHAYAAGTDMDGRTFVKCLKDSGLLDEQLKTSEADIIFAKYKAKGVRKIDFQTFLAALAEVSRKRRMKAEHVFDVVCNSNGPDYQLSSGGPLEVAGPERFFYDRATYTGTHRCGGPTSEGDVITDQGLVNRDRQHEMAASAERRAKGALAETAPLPTLLGRGRRPQSLQEATKLASPRTSALEKHPAARSSKVKESCGASDAPLCSPLRGPERFFYDRSTYTGTHKNNGPTSSGSGVGKDGYSDLDVLVRRELVQDDNLQRRRRHAVVGSRGNSPSASRCSSPGIGGGSMPCLLEGLHSQGAEPKRPSPRPTWSQSAPAQRTLASSLSEQDLVRRAAKMPSAPLMGTRYIRGADAAPIVATAVATYSLQQSAMSIPSQVPLVRSSGGWVPIAFPQSGSFITAR